MMTPSGLSTVSDVINGLVVPHAAPDKNNLLIRLVINDQVMRPLQSGLLVLMCTSDKGVAFRAPLANVSNFLRGTKDSTRPDQLVVRQREKIQVREDAMVLITSLPNGQASI